MNSRITYAIDMYQNGNTGDKIQGITIMVDGDFRKDLDAIMAKNEKYPNYVDVINDALFKGLKIIEEQDK